MAKPGYYRYKISDLTPGEHTFTWFVNGVIAGTSKVIIKEFCPNKDKYLKYLDKDGIYRFFPFNSRWEQIDKPTIIGKSNSLITSLKDAKSNSLNLGYKNKRVLTLVAENVSQEELDVLQDIFVSPRVYLNGKEKEDWVLVTLSGDGIGKRKRNEFGKFVVDIELPEYYTISAI